MGRRSEADPEKIQYSLEYDKAESVRNVQLNNWPLESRCEEPRFAATAGRLVAVRDRDY